MKTGADDGRDSGGKPMGRRRKIVLGLVLAAVALTFYVSIMVKIAYYGP